MSLPTKISPDNLTDAIVDIRFKSKVPEAVVLGYFHNVLSSEYEYVKVKTNLQSKSGLAQDFALTNVPTYLDPEKKVKILTTQNQINFNIVNNYIGWGEYFSIIKKTLQKLHETKVIEYYDKIGIRYISEYRNKSVFDYLKGSFSIFDDSNNKRSNTQIRTQFEDGNYRSIVTIVDNFVRPHNETIETFSLIDVDSQYLGPHTIDLEPFLKIINETHEKQKSRFFSLVNDNFLTEFNPQY